jgi:hypothetical protein
MIFWPERYVHVSPLHLSSRLNALSQANLLLELLPLCLQGDGHATSEDHIDFSHLFVVVGIDSAMFTLMGLLGHRCCWLWYLLLVQNFFAIFWIMSSDTMDLAPLLCIVRAIEMPLFLSKDCCWRYPRSPQSLRSPRSVVLTSRSSSFFFEGPLPCDSRSQA